MGIVSGPLLWTLVSLLALYFVFVVWIGKKGNQHSRSMNGFATARGNVSPWLVGASYAASFASANLFVGVPGLAYEHGVSVLWYTLGGFGAGWIALLLFAKKFWKYGKKFGGVSTLPEWLGRRYNSKTLQVLVTFLVLFNVYYIVGQNVGLATIFESVIGIPYFWGILIGVTITILYIGLGGAFAQIVTDGIQGTLMVITSILIFASLFWTIGGGLNVFGELSTKLEAIDPELIAPLNGPYDSVLAILSVQFLHISFVVMPHLLNKVLSLETEDQLRPFTMSAGLGMFFITVLMVLGGLAARVLAPSLSSADSAIPVYVLEAFPPIIAAIIIVGIISAILSSTDSLYLSITSSIGNDLYKVLAPILSKGKLSKHQLDVRSVKVAKGSLIFVGLATFYLSLDRPDSLAILIQFSFSAIISGLLAPIVLGYLWGKSNGYGAIASLISGTGLYVLFTSLNVFENIYISLFLAAAAGFVVMIVTSLVTTSNVTKEEEDVFLKDVL
ncbi:sodium:solute symporter family protein [Halobacillus amylolyticus]|uniref:Sodium:solute symporter family protein n=1 Tax=Halobacillus amylolyticus TaxID=2932259 RepID=A0ABY4HJE2_9BACI|nr:sodium:solute symporter family protein [Halobacillus amylolyticus]UOR13595.1 sodium:solute symporter family protein [Halobacillus amylolyticus]